MEKQLGTKLPGDYKAFVAAYGAGSFGNFYFVYTPSSPGLSDDLVERLTSKAEIYRQIRDDSDEDDFPFPVFPEAGGLLAWGNDSNGNDYFWLTKGKNPDKWTVVSFKVRGEQGREHPATMTGYLLGVMEERINPLASDFPGQGSFRFARARATPEDTIAEPERRDS